MSEKSSQGPRAGSLISRIESDGTIIETLYRPDTVETLFVVADDGGIRNLPNWKGGAATYAPVNPRNNLLRHEALVLPSEAEAFGTVGELLDDICSHIAAYVSLAPEALAISAAYVLLSWVYDAFNELPYLRFRGDYGTGKTRALIIVGSLCYKAFFASGASTVSPIFHTLDTFKGTLVFDEADFRFTDEKAELVKILNNGNVKGFPVLRTQVTPKREFDPRAFTIFGPKIVGMRRSYEDRALESRFLTIEMRPGRSLGVPLNLQDEQKMEALRLRNKLLMYRLRHRLAVRLDPSLADPALEPRLNQILLPLLSVAPKATHPAIRTAASELQAVVLSERSESAEGKALAVLSRLQDQHKGGSVPLSAIAAAFAAEHGKEFDRPIGNRWIGATLRRLGIVLYKSNGVFVLAPGQRERLDALRTRYGIAIEVESTRGNAT